MRFRLKSLQEEEVCESQDSDVHLHLLYKTLNAKRPGKLTLLFEPPILVYFSAEIVIFSRLDAVTTFGYITKDT